MHHPAAPLALVLAAIALLSACRPTPPPSPTVAEAMPAILRKIENLELPAAYVALKELSREHPNDPDVKRLLADLTPVLAALVPDATGPSSGPSDPSPPGTRPPPALRRVAGPCPDSIHPVRETIPGTRRASRPSSADQSILPRTSRFPRRLAPASPRRPSAATPPRRHLRRAKPPRPRSHPFHRALHYRHHVRARGRRLAAASLSLTDP